MAWCKVDLKTGDPTPVPGTIHDLHDTRSQSDGRLRLFGLKPPDGKVTTVALPQDNAPWTHLNLSPDGRRAVANHKGRVQLIDIVQGTAVSLGDGFLHGDLVARTENGSPQPRTGKTAIRY